MNLKQFAHSCLNERLLKPLGYRLSKRIGSDFGEDAARLLGRDAVSCIVDGGAYIGSFSLEMAAAFPKARIDAFEPTPDSFRRLAVNVAAQERVHCHAAALGREAGRAQLVMNASPLTNSLREATTAAGSYFGGLLEKAAVCETDVVTLADWAGGHDVSAIDILKLDLQGGELDALVGLGDLIGAVKLAFLEVQFVEFYKDSPLFSEVEAFLREAGLAFYQFYELVRSPSDGRLLYGDAAFVRADIIDRDGHANRDGKRG